MAEIRNAETVFVRAVGSETAVHSEVALLVRTDSSSHPRQVSPRQGLVCLQTGSCQTVPLMAPAKPLAAVCWNVAAASLQTEQTLDDCFMSPLVFHFSQFNISSLVGLQTT